MDVSDITPTTSTAEAMEAAEAPSTGGVATATSTGVAITMDSVSYSVPLKKERLNILSHVNGPVSYTHLTLPTKA